MNIEYVRYKIPENLHADFERDYEAASSHLEASEHCLACELAKCEEEPDRYILRLEWTSTKDHLEGFRGSEEFARFLPHIRAYIGNLEEMQHYEVLDLGFRK